MPYELLYFSVFGLLFSLNCTFRCINLFVILLILVICVCLPSCRNHIFMRAVLWPSWGISLFCHSYYSTYKTSLKADKEDWDYVCFLFFELIGLTWSHFLISLFLTWSHIVSQRLTRTHKDSQGIARTHKDSQGLTRTHKDSQGLTRTHLVSLGLANSGEKWRTDEWLRPRPLGLT